jgi:hypothetical protein
MSDASGTSDFSYEQRLAKWRMDEESRAREALKEAASSIERVTRLAASRGVSLSSDSFRYINKIGVVAEAPSLAKTLLRGVQIDKDGLYHFGDVARQLPTAQRREGCFNGDEYIVMANLALGVECTQKPIGLRDSSNYFGHLMNPGLKGLLQSTVIESGSMLTAPTA